MNDIGLSSLSPLGWTEVVVGALGAIVLIKLVSYKLDLAIRRGKSVLIYKTSRLSAAEVIRDPIQAVRNLKEKLKEERSDILSEIVVPLHLENRLRDVAVDTKNTTQKRGIYKNILLHCPWGTGKTLFAKKLALHSGMDYAILDGLALALYGVDSVRFLHHAFDWAETSRKGLLLFINRSEGLSSERSSTHSAEHLRAVHHAFLSRTAEKSNKVMLVLASTSPEQLDRAVKDRFDERVEFQFPGLEERERLMRLYFDEFVLEHTTKPFFFNIIKRRNRLAQFDYGALCVKIAQNTEGRTLKQLWDLKYGWEISATEFEDGKLTEQEFIDECLKDTWYLKTKNV